MRPSLTRRTAPGTGQPVRFVETMAGTVAPIGTWTPPPGWDAGRDGEDEAAAESAVAAAAAGARAGPAAAREPLVLAGLQVAVGVCPGPDDGLPGRLIGGEVDHFGRRWRVSGGSFTALAATPDGGRRLRYRLDAVAGGQRIEVLGVKTVPGGLIRLWRQTTTLAVLVVHPDEHPPTAWAGTLRLTPGEFARQLTTMRGRPGAVAAFGLRFVRRLPLRAR